MLPVRGATSPWQKKRMILKNDYYYEDKPRNNNNDNSNDDNIVPVLPDGLVYYVKRNMNPVRIEVGRIMMIDAIMVVDVSKKLSMPLGILNSCVIVQPRNRRRLSTMVGMMEVVLVQQPISSDMLESIVNIPWKNNVMPKIQIDFVSMVEIVIPMSSKFSPRKNL